MESVEFDYRVVSKGWSRAWLRIGEREATVTASCLRDALGGLLRAVLEFQKGAAESRTSWDEEPGEFRWIFTRQQHEHVRVRILWFTHLWNTEADEAGEVRFEATCHFGALREAITKGARRVLTDLGYEGYRREWVEHDFPLPELMALEQRLI